MWEESSPRSNHTQLLDLTTFLDVLINWLTLMSWWLFVRICSNSYSITRLSTGAPQPCVFSSQLFTLLAHNCNAMQSSYHFSHNEKSAYSEEVEQLAIWCKENNLSLNVRKLKRWSLTLENSTLPTHPLA